MLPASEFLIFFFKRFRSFNAVNMESVGQGDSKLLAVKVRGLKKKPTKVALNYWQIKGKSVYFDASYNRKRV